MSWIHELFINEAKPALDRHSGGGEPINNQDKSITQNGIYTADEGYTGLGIVSVNVAREDQVDIAARFNAVIDGSITEISSDVTTIREYAFYKCSNLTTANFPAATSIGQYAFYYCTALSTLNFPVATSIGQSAFNGCTALTTVNFLAATSIDANAFIDCSKLTTAIFPVATSIGNYAFRGCSKLTYIDFLAATSIGSSAFENCSKLITLILRSATMVVYGTNMLQRTPIASGTGYIYVPASLIDTYKAASKWSTYANQFRALEDYTVDGTTTGELDSSKI